QGDITDRTAERLTELDRGLLLYRKLLRQEMDKVQAGQDPINVFRDPAGHKPIQLPVGGGVEKIDDGRARLHEGTDVDSHERYRPVLAQVADLSRRIEEAQLAQA